MKQKQRRLVRIVAIGAAAIYLLLRPQESAQSVRDGMSLCFERIIPALFPYLVLSGLFLSSGGAQSLGRCIGKQMQSLFHVDKSGVIALILGLTGGYPVGAKTAAQLCRNGILAKDDAQRLLVFCNNAGPAFLFGVVGAACYRSAAVGAALYGIHILSALLCGLILRGQRTSGKSDLPAKPIPRFSEAFLSAVTDAGRTLVSICLLVTLFSLCIDALRSVLPRNVFVDALLSSFLEVSSGCLSIVDSSLPWAAKFSLTAGAVGWGGLCVHLQTMTAVQSAGLSVRPYLRAKALQSILSVLLALPTAPLLAPVAQASVSGAVFVPFSPVPWTLFSIGMTCLIFLQFHTSNLEKKGL